MHPYLITAKPGRIRRALAVLRRWSVRALALAVMVVLGVVVLLVRCARPIVNYLATRLVFLELWAAQRLGRPPVSGFVGAGITDEFVREFHRARQHATAGSPT
ncbi:MULTISPECIES: hypothetical protein [Streptomyces]|uniref:hypothetical protein n=1 Tax=Streptomyces TaxID=1883 RepID=UPI000DFA1944|nr:MULTISPECIES: hypothetical protein [Streptomyces]MBT3077610.1 hypothetical protein [Streptomyces sp. COG21]MBT3084456.1 hypothetical protein [Streptomyces sp. COG20]MBT3085363.1 hypothetical protein [Streptomyces sp. CYG21]MBT3095917.1 hypothetical protein [Streptomyces sp. CBG30]MBT3103594.1 hypothetical protein [Streptomyces sp. COG19]